MRFFVMFTQVFFTPSKAAEQGSEGGFSWPPFCVNPMQLLRGQFNELPTLWPSGMAELSPNINNRERRPSRIEEG